MDMLRVTARWSGWSGAPGYSNFYFGTDPGFFDGGLLGDAAAAAALSAQQRVYSAFLTMRAQIPSGLTVTSIQGVDVLDSDSGEIQGVIDTGDDLNVTGTGAGGFSAASGAVVNWRTNDYRFGRRIRGRTFLVPITGSAYEDDGSLTSSALGDFREFAEDMVNGGGAPVLGVWSRPRAGAGGVFASVTGANVPDMAAVLRSRRD